MAGNPINEFLEKKDLRRQEQEQSAEEHKAMMEAIEHFQDVVGHFEEMAKQLQQRIDIVETKLDTTSSKMTALQDNLDSIEDRIMTRLDVDGNNIIEKIQAADEAADELMAKIAEIKDSKSESWQESLVRYAVIGLVVSIIVVGAIYKFCRPEVDYAERLFFNATYGFKQNPETGESEKTDYYIRFFDEENMARSIIDQARQKYESQNP